MEAAPAAKQAGSVQKRPPNDRLKIINIRTVKSEISHRCTHCREAMRGCAGKNTHVIDAVR